ncbi:hypothetical protein [Niallia sp. 03133]
MNIERDDIITDDFLNQIVKEINDLYGWQPQSLDNQDDNEKTAKEN